jgi:DNA polymerase I-like protein with 3'-5' exonuclease and polymerase domains
MVEMFNNGLDPYREVAGRQFNIAPSDIAKKSKERTIGKTTCLACIYTGTKYTIQRQLVAGTQGELTMTLDEAQHAHDVFFDLCPGIKKHAEDSAYEAAHRGYYTTVLGRKRKFNKKALDEDKYDAVKKAWKYYTPWEVVDSNGRVSKDPLALLRYSHKSFRNVSNNHKFQGTASEALKRSLAKIPFVEYGWQMLSPTHDDIVILAPDSHREYLEYIVPKIMLEELRRILLIPPTAIPITLELEGTCGRCWASYLQDPKRYVIPKTPGYYQEPIGRWALPHDNETIIRY